MNLITIQDVAKALGVSYHVARNRLNRQPETEQYKHKLGHTVVYEEAALELVKEDDKCNQ